MSTFKESRGPQRENSKKQRRMNCNGGLLRYLRGGTHARRVFYVLKKEGLTEAFGSRNLSERLTRRGGPRRELEGTGGGGELKIGGQKRLIPLVKLFFSTKVFEGSERGRLGKQKENPWKGDIGEDRVANCLSLRLSRIRTVWRIGGGTGPCPTTGGKG